MIGRRSLVGALLTVALPWPMACAEDGFFAGKTITYIISTKPGGGYDTMGRLVAKYLEAHIPGSRVIVKNIPGAGHLVGCQAIYNAPPDGLTIGSFNTGLVYSQLSGAFDTDLDLAKMSWIGKAAVESRVMVVAAKSNIARVEDLKSKDRVYTVAASGKGNAAHVDSMLLARSFGYNLKPIFGFEGTDSELSILRGEIDIILASRSSMEPFVASGHGRFLLEFGGAPGSMIPQAAALAKTDEDRAVIGLIDAQARFARLTAGPPGIAPERLQLLRRAYLDALTDPAFLAEARTLNLPIAPASGEVVDERIRAALNPPAEIRSLIRQLLN
jgi:tripartite-type tricarboxylate transporter receptor subunit TctC